MESTLAFLVVKCCCSENTLRLDYLKHISCWCLEWAHPIGQCSVHYFVLIVDHIGFKCNVHSEAQ